MAQNGTVPSELTAAQRRAIEALLSEPSIEAAAEASGVGRRTLHRWLADDVAFTAALRASMRSISASMSRADGTPSLLRALATRSSKMFSSLSHWPAALLPMSLAMLLMRWVASLMRSSATAWDLRWIDRPSLTRVSKALPPSAWALEKAPRPASQICCAESLIAPDRGEAVEAEPALEVPVL